MPEPAPSSRSGTPSEVCVQTEAESGRGWTFGVTVGRGAEASELTLTLSWADYEHWSHGSFSPSRVAEAVLVALREAEPGRELPAKFDCATARRWVRGFDERVREVL